MRPSSCCAIMLLVLTASMGAKPIIQGVLQEQMRPAFFGAVQSLSAAVSFFVASPLGRLTDLHGRSPALVAMLCVLIAAFGSLATAGPHTFMLCSALVIMQSMRIEDTLKAAISDSTDAKNQYRWVQVFFACGGIGFGTGPMVGKVANSYLGFTGTFLLLSSFFFLAGVVIWADSRHVQPSLANQKASMQGDPVPIREVLVSVVRDSRLRDLFLMRLCHACAAHTMLSTLGLFMTSALGEPKEKFADLLTMMSSVFTSVQLVQPLVSKFIGLSCESAITLGMTIIFCGRILLLVWATSFLRCFICYSIVIVGIGFYMPAASAAVTAAADANTVGFLLGLSTNMEIIAETTMPFLAGLVFESFGPYGPCAFSLFFSAIGLAPALASHLQQGKSAIQDKKDT